MDLLVMLLSAGLFPVVVLGFLLWMARYEDGLPTSVSRAARAPDPPPILRVPVQRKPPTSVVQRSEVSRSAGVSLGGSTNR